MASNHDRTRRTSGAAAISILVLLIGGLTGCDLGAMFDVTSTADAVDADPGDGACATATGDCTLRAAVQETNALAGSATIFLVPDTVYTLTIAGPWEDDAASGDLDITTPYTHLVGGGATIDGGSTFERIIDHHAGRLQIDDLTITHGNGSGAGLRNRGDVDLVRVKLWSNTIGGGGTEQAGLAIEHLAGQLNIVDSDISYNTQTELAGRIGAILQAGGSMTMVNSTVSHNEGRASLQWVGQGTYAAFFQTAGSATIVNSEISNNTGGESHWICLDPPDRGCTDRFFQRHAVGVLAAGDVEIRHSSVLGHTTDLATSGPTFTDAGTATPRIAASVFGSCTATHVTSQGYNRFGTASCAPVPSDKWGVTAIVDKIPVGTPALCDATTPADRLGVARPQGAACDVGPLEQ